MILEKNRSWNLNLILKDLSPCIFCFYFRTSNFHVWRHSVDYTFPRFRARDPFFDPDTQLQVQEKKAID